MSIFVIVIAIAIVIVVVVIVVVVIVIVIVTITLSAFTRVFGNCCESDAMHGMLSRPSLDGLCGRGRMC